MPYEKGTVTMNNLKFTLALIIFIALLVVAGCGQEESDPRAMGDLCGVILAGSSEEYPTKLREASVGSDLVDQFPPVSLNCSSTSKDGVSRRRSIYITFEDDHGAVAVAAVLHENEEISKQKSEINQTFYRLDLIFEEKELEEGHFLLGWSSNHPRVEEAQNLHAESVESISLADIVSRLSEERTEN